MAGSLLIPVGGSCFEYCTCAMDKKEMTTNHSIISYPTSAEGEELFVGCIFELIKEVVPRVIEAKFAPSGSENLQKFILKKLKIDDNFRDDVLDFIRKNYLKSTYIHDGCAVAAIVRLENDHSNLSLKETISEHYYQKFTSL